MFGVERVRLFVLIAATAVLGIMAYSLYGERKTIAEELMRLRAEHKKYSSENADLLSKIEYFKIPENLLKESRSQFNYVLPGEKLIILVPEAKKEKAQE
jgi:cell division protein FtsB